MKKSILIALILSLCTLYLNAKTVPDGRQLFGAIHQYCQKHYGYLESADVSVNGKGEETYIIKEVGINWKDWVGSERNGEYYYYITRWDFATIKKETNGKIKATLSKKKITVSGKIADIEKNDNDRNSLCV